MIKNVLMQIEDVGIFPVIGLILFFTFFTGMLLWVFFLKKSHVEAMSMLPLESKPTALPTGELDHD